MTQFTQAERGGFKDWLHIYVYYGGKDDILYKQMILGVNVGGFKSLNVQVLKFNHTDKNATQFIKEGSWK